MPVPTWSKQPPFLYSYDVSDGLYLTIVAAANDFNTPITQALTRGIYCLTAVGADVVFGIEDVAATATNGAHLPAGDTRLIVIPDAGATLSVWIYDAAGADAKLNIAKQRPVPEIF